MFSHEYQSRCEGSTLTPSGDGCRQRGADWIALGSTIQSPEANTGYSASYYVTQATWTAPVTNKLPEAGFTRFAYHEQRPWTDASGRNHGADPGDGAIRDRQPSGELRLSRREQLLLQLGQPGQLARVGVVHHRITQPESGLPGVVFDRTR
jgi:hypothetical protein